MRTFRTRIYWLSLLAYLWTATGSSNVALITAFIDNHSSEPIVVMAGQGEEVIVHHVGHRDVHEPTAIDTHENADGLVGDANHAHSDHVLKLDGDARSSGPFAKDVKLTNLLNVKLCAVTPRLLETASIPAHDFLPAHGAIRNSTIAFVQVTRLRI